MPRDTHAFRTLSNKYDRTNFAKNSMKADWQGPNYANVGANNDTATLPIKEQRWKYFK